MPEYKFVTYEKLDSGKVARIMLNRPEARTPKTGGSWSTSTTPSMEAEADVIPLGKAHLDAARIGAASPLESTAVGHAAFVEEALRWLPEEAAASGEELTGVEKAASYGRMTMRTCARTLAGCWAAASRWSRCPMARRLWLRRRLIRPI